VVNAVELSDAATGRIEYKSATIPIQYLGDHDNDEVLFGDFAFFNGNGVSQDLT
jgi:hypothetical protein